MHLRLSRLNAGRFSGVIAALLTSNLVSLILFLARAADTGNTRYWFMLWNLVLGWVPLLLAVLLRHNLRHKSWISGSNLTLTALWLGFLPNSFYVISDLIHVHTTGEVSLLYDIVMFMSFIFNALVVGFMSMVIVHKQLLRRVRRRDAHIVFGLIILACSFAIYLGRYLRWNTWDLLVNPAGLLFDVSDRVINPSAHPQALVTTGTFFLVIGSMYIVAWQLASLISHKSQS